MYDKSKYSGKGDRSEKIVQVKAPIDLVVFEGWCTGFHSVPLDHLAQLYKEARTDTRGFANRHLDYEEPFFLQHQLEHLEQVNGMLKQYEEHLWKYLDCFVQLKPENMGYVWKWRLQQEHNMKAKNGGIGMSDGEVKTFIGRYMPGYELFMHGLADSKASWSGRGLRLVLDADRNIKGEESF